MNSDLINDTFIVMQCDASLNGAESSLQDCVLETVNDCSCDNIARLSCDPGIIIITMIIIVKL